MYRMNRIQEAFLTPNPYSRPQIKIKEIKYIVIHWVGNAGTSAMANRNYFESLKTKKIYASSHYIIGLQGEIIECIPEDEVAYHAKQANSYSIGIENCHPDWEGKFNTKTYESLIQLCAILCERYKLDPMVALKRHYDITGKQCPKYYIQNEEEWQTLKKDVSQQIEMLLSPLKEAVMFIVGKGIILDIGVWGSKETMNMKYAKLMVERIGRYFGKTNYKDTIDFLVEKQCINTRSIWDKYQFKPEWCEALLIKVARLLKE